MKPEDRNKIYIRYLFLILFVTLGCLILFSLITSLVLLLIEGGGEVLSGKTGTSEVLLLKLLQVVLMVGIFGLSPFLLGKVLKFNSVQVYRMSFSPPWLDYLLTLILFVIILPFLQWTIIINEQMNLPDWMSSVENWMKSMENQMAQQTELFLRMGNYGDLLVNIVVIALIPAFFEELFFRGLLQSFFVEWIRKPIVAIILTSLFFSAVHLQFYGFLPRFILGVVLGLLFYYSGSLWVPAFFHFVNNAVSIVFSYLDQHHLISHKFEEKMASSDLIVIISLTVVAAGLIYLARYYERKRDKSKDWVKVYETENSSEAEILAGKLENAGIPVSILNKKDSSFTTFGLIEIYVYPENEAEAKKIIYEDFSELQPE